MGTVVKASVIILLGGLALYLVIFLIAVPAMSSRSVTAHKVGGNVYVALYRPVRDVLPEGFLILELWRDYEHYWCSQSESCVL